MDEAVPDARTGLEVILALLQPRAPPRGPPPSPGTRRRRRRRRHQYHSDRLPYFHQNAKACCYSELAMPEATFNVHTNGSKEMSESERTEHSQTITWRLAIMSQMPEREQQAG
ncbi:hypothetical protein PCANC_01369 [Puccinia coronata f. sp. avenae]|uniref:Uncharacterized protein n=1 Tax=Puccinia coronata f. sp. avenae TaxID=200324 RepID=A0A2N5W6C0_9BASI|nr:hypothetical protein PCANC_14985 [Puccinia coronata f. sp. avenae]PLW50915.1 hypothetical protein PCASD_01145 [Puccinia coronata f. sp. avenae]PLW57770.1 hypothetical protein PCANC_01369 [Puccinia coronata f. sp. avenae]